MDELRLLIDFTRAPDLYEPEARKALIRDAVKQLSDFLDLKSVKLTVITPFQYEETIANNCKLSDWANEGDGNS